MSHLLPNVIGVHHQIRVIYAVSSGGDAVDHLRRAYERDVTIERRINPSYSEKTSIRNLFVSKNVAKVYKVFEA